ncbi:hypothetical protein CALCODRAFT_496628 [Calocera cornea HHB12733]|uniref:DAGKc domain-containing protein n=1 Tax=Calocera cornea HHB12733 TaxID=1353952 RepID=A0A165FNC7_9BASI|nr:hypothetical protein CALCODRAFT_496628 [Calocera cornea HHB12733]
MTSPVLVISNPASGDRTGPQFLATHVLPLLDAHTIKYTIKETDAPQHAGELAAHFLASLGSDDGPVTIIIGGGDGTLHEVVNAPLRPEEGGTLPTGGVRLVILPLGTANALYSSFFPPSTSLSQDVEKLLSAVPEDVKPKLLSLAEFLLSATGAQGKHQRLTLTQTSISLPSTTRQRPEQIISAVVTSTCLHAAIVDTAEALREEYPGVERFKQAAARNIDKWYNAWVTLLPFPGSEQVQKYDPTEGAFVDLEEEEGTEFEGPFAYFLSTVNVDRLEPDFRITPLSRSLPAPQSTSAMDVLFIRPLRDPAFTKDLTAARAGFPGKVMAAMQGAYQDGKHVGLRYDETGEVGPWGEGKTVVEYFRCGGWVWTHESPGDSSTNLVCADGAIRTIPPSGRAVCEVVASTGGQFSVWASRATSDRSD